MLKLGVNIDHVATLREARYRGSVLGEPDPVGAALICESAGAHGITAHLRETAGTSGTATFGDCARSSKPAQPRNGPPRKSWHRPQKKTGHRLHRPGKAPKYHRKRAGRRRPTGALTESRQKLNDAGIAVSLFIAPDPAHRSRRATGSQFIDCTGVLPRVSCRRARERAGSARRRGENGNAGPRVSAGHD